MKYSLFIAVLAIILLPFNTQADEQEKKFTLGAGTYDLRIAYDNSSLVDGYFSGVGVSASYAFTNKYAIRGEYYRLEHDDDSGLDVDGFDLVGYYGTGLITKGIKAYVGGGIFTEMHDSSNLTENFKGLQLNGGIGYNWDAVSLEFVLGIRDVSEYKDYIEDTGGISTKARAVSGSIIFSARI